MARGFGIVVFFGGSEGVTQPRSIPVWVGMTQKAVVIGRNRERYLRLRVSVLLGETAHGDSFSDPHGHCDTDSGFRRVRATDWRVGQHAQRRTEQDQVSLGSHSLQILREKKCFLSLVLLASLATRKTSWR